MNTKRTIIQLNQVQACDWDYERIDSEFDIYEVRLDRHMDRNILNIEDTTVRILATVYYPGQQCLVMTRKGQTSGEILEYTLNKGIQGKGSKIFIRKLWIAQIAKKPADLRKMFGYRNRVLLQLLINSTLNSLFPEEEYRNITGRCYYYNSSWSDKKEKIELVDLTLERDMVMFPSVVTFTKERPKEGKPSERIVLDSTSLTVRKALVTDADDTVYYKQGIEGTHATRSYDGTTLAYWEKSRLSCMAKFFRSVSKQLLPYVHMSFSKIETIEASTASLGFETECLTGILQTEGICLVDRVVHSASEDVTAEDTAKKAENKRKHRLWVDESRNAYKDYLSLVCEQSGIPISVGNTNPNRLNIEIVRDEKFYAINDNLEDPYRKTGGITCQHATVPVAYRNAYGEYTKAFEERIKTILKELAIKADLRDRRIRLVDWKLYGVLAPITFFCARPCATEQDRRKGVRPVLFAGMTIFPDGTFQTELFKVSNIKYPEWKTPRQYAVMKCFFRENVGRDSEYFDRSVEIVCFQKDDIDSAYVIRRTNVRAMSNIEEMYDIFMDEKKDVYIDSDTILSAIEGYQYDKNPGTVEVYYNICSAISGKEQILKSELLPLLYPTKKEGQKKVNICTKIKESIANASGVVIKAGRRGDDSRRMGTDVYQHIHFWESTEYDEEDDLDESPAPVVNYVVGQFGTPNQSVSTSPVMRQIIRIDGGRPIHKDVLMLIEMMQVGFVKSKTYTVLPFPAKYLREILLQESI